MSTSGRPSKVLLYSHDTYGLGHLRRNLAIAGRLLGERQASQVVLASGSPVLDQVPGPDGLVRVALPPVVKAGAGEYRPLHPQLSLSLVRRARSALLSEIAARWQPDVLLVDHAPQGMQGELLAVFEHLHATSPHTKIVLGLRDILDEPERVRAGWTTDGVYRTLETEYDRILVYGEQEIFDLVRAYRLPEPVAARVQYCGYVTGPAPQRSAIPPGLEPGCDYLLGTVGGGGEGADVLLATGHAAVRAGMAAVLCTGPLMTRAEVTRLQQATGGLPGVRVVEQLADMAGLARAARAVVSRGGYNSLCELVHLAVPTVVIPRTWPRREQLLRARAFADRGLVQLVEEGSSGLAERLDRALALVAVKPAGRRPVDLQGAGRVAAALAAIVGGAEPATPARSRIDVEIPA